MIWKALNDILTKPNFQYLFGSLVTISSGNLVIGYCIINFDTKFVKR